MLKSKQRITTSYTDVLLWVKTISKILNTYFNHSWIVYLIQHCYPNLFLLLKTNVVLLFTIIIRDGDGCLVDSLDLRRLVEQHHKLLEWLHQDVVNDLDVHTLSLERSGGEREYLADQGTVVATSCRESEKTVTLDSQN